MIFTNEEWEDKAEKEEIIVCGTYHTYRINGVKNPSFDLYSGGSVIVKC